MKVTGFTFIRNAIICDYPIVETIKSLLPICDEVVVAVGKSDDNTLELIKSIHPQKVKVVETVWDNNLREGGRVLAVETDKAFHAISSDTDWCFYLQGDEVFPEYYLENVRSAMLKYKDDKEVDGLLFNYFHFYGSYNYVADSLNWHKKETRVIRKQKDIFSYGDAHGFRKYTAANKVEKLSVKPVDAFIHHYGWVKNPQAQQRKQETFHQLWHTDEWVEKNVIKADEYDYGNIDSLKEFDGIHPQVMKERIERVNWKFEFDTSKSKMKLKYRVRRWIEKVFGISIGEYRNYKLIK